MPGALHEPFTTHDSCSVKADESVIIDCFQDFKRVFVQTRALALADTISAVL
jgi:hypothetical protein